MNMIKKSLKIISYFRPKKSCFRKCLNKTSQKIGGFLKIFDKKNRFGYHLVYNQGITKGYGNG